MISMIKGEFMLYLHKNCNKSVIAADLLNKRSLLWMDLSV